MSISDQLFEYIGDRFDIGDDPDYTKDVDLFDYGFVDSLGATEIIFYIEETFDIEISQKDIMLYPMNTVNEIVKVIEDKR